MLVNTPTKRDAGQSQHMAKGRGPPDNFEECKAKRTSVCTSLLRMATQKQHYLSRHSSVCPQGSLGEYMALEGPRPARQMPTVIAGRNVLQPKHLPRQRLPRGPPHWGHMSNSTQRRQKHKRSSPRNGAPTRAYHPRGAARLVCAAHTPKQNYKKHA